MRDSCKMAIQLGHPFALRLCLVSTALRGVYRTPILCLPRWDFLKESKSFRTQQEMRCPPRGGPSSHCFTSLHTQRIYLCARIFPLPLSLTLAPPSLLLPLHALLLSHACMCIQMSNQDGRATSSAPHPYTILHRLADPLKHFMLKILSSSRLICFFPTHAQAVDAQNAFSNTHAQAVHAKRLKKLQPFTLITLSPDSPMRSFCSLSNELFHKAMS